jgi:hypothetical protein
MPLFHGHVIVMITIRAFRSKMKRQSAFRTKFHENLSVLPYIVLLFETEALAVVKK